MADNEFEKDLTGEILRPRRSRKGERAPLSRMAKDWLRSALFDNAALKFVAFVLALTVFILVHSDEDAVISASVGVSYTMPKDRVLVSMPVSQVRITVKGTRRRLKRFDERELERIHVDLTHMSSGDFLFQSDMIKLPEGLELVSINPPSMRLVFEQRAEKSVPVVVDTSGVPARGYKVARITARPSQVIISGARSRVLSTTTVRTREVSLEGRTESFQQTVSLEPPAEAVEFVGDSAVTIEVTITEEQGMRAMDDAEIQIRPGAGVSEQMAKRFSATPSQVRVVLRGSILQLEKLDLEKIKPYVEIYVDDIMTNRARKAQVRVPVGEGIGTEVRPREVMLGPRSSEAP